MRPDSAGAEPYLQRTFETISADLSKRLARSRECRRRRQQMLSRRVIVVHTGLHQIVFTRNEDGTIDGPLGNMKRRRS